MNNNRKVAPAPPPKKPNKNNKPNEYIQLENSDTEDGSTTRSTPGARSAADLFDRRQAHSDVEVQRAPHPQIQWLQMNNETHNKKAASLPTGASPISPRQNFSFPGQRSPAFRCAYCLIFYAFARSVCNSFKVNVFQPQPEPLTTLPPDLAMASHPLPLSRIPGSAPDEIPHGTNRTCASGQTNASNRPESCANS